MKKIKEAKEILKSLGLPKAQQNDRSALILLALCGIKKSHNWKDAKAMSMGVVGNKDNPKYPGIMRFVNANYKKSYAENSRETFRRESLQQFVQANLVYRNPENPLLPTNSKDNHYRISDEALHAIRTFGTSDWEKEIMKFKETSGSLSDKYNKVSEANKIAVKLFKGKMLTLSPGSHNKLQALIVNDFTPRFAKNSELLYLGDTIQKDLFFETERLNFLKIPITQHSKLPDILIYDKKKNWLYLIEAVTSHGPVSPKRFIELEELLKNCKAGKIYVSAFLDFGEFRRHITNIAWETEVWIAENPDHLIHFNGDRFMGPR